MSVDTQSLQKFCAENKGKKILLFDLETTGLPVTKGFNKYHPYELNQYYDSSRIIQFAYCFFELGNTKKDNLVIYDFLRYPEVDMVINEKSFSIHNISLDTLKTKGKPFLDIIKESDIIKLLNECDYIISHNINFDLNILCNELHRVNISINPDWNKKCFCTCKSTRFTKLSKLYTEVVKDDSELYFHNAYYDVLAVFRILLELST